MKYFILLFCIVFYSKQVFSQIKYKNVIVTTEVKFYKMKPNLCSYNTRETAANVNCSSFECDGDIVELAFTRVIDFYSDSATTEYFKLIDKEVENLIQMGPCINKKNLLLHVPVGAFIRFKEGFDYYDDNFEKLTTKTNLSRFVEKYGEKLSKTFPKQKIYIIEHNG